MRRVIVKGAAAALAAALAGVPLPARAASSHHVTLKTYAFHPAVLSVRAGDTVTWTNEDTAAHNVVTTSGPASLHSPMLAKGRSWSFTFRVAGTYAYYCSVHPDMRAQVVAAAAPTPTTSRATTSKKSAAHGRTKAASPAPASPGATDTLPILTPTASPVVAQPAAAESKSLNPLLPLTGLVCAVAVFCLLLLTSAAGGRPSSD